MEIVNSGVGTALFQMQTDSELIAQLSSLKEPVLRLWKWQKKTISYGYFIDPTRFIDCDKAIGLGYEIVRRPTGGGLLFHINDFAFSVAVPFHHPHCSLVVLENYHLINQALIAALTNCSLSTEVARDLPYRDLCMATPTKYDLVYNGKKIGGAAERKTAGGFLHQGSLFLQMPCWEEVALFYKGPIDEIEAMKEQSITIPELPEQFESHFALSLEHSLRQPR